MTEIWKYELPLSEEPVILIPHGARPLGVQLQHDKPTVWMLVDPERERDEYHFRVVGTGHPFDLWDWHYIGTWQADGFVWHLFGPTARLT